MTSYGPAPQTPKPPASPEQRVALFHYVAAGLGVLAFVWGFLDWYGEGDQAVGGYSIAGAGAAAVVGLALVAGGLAAAGTFEKKPVTLTPVVIAAAGLLVVFGILIGKDSIGDSASVDAKVGLILALITSILQTAVLVFAWLTSTGRLPAPSHGQSHGQQSSQPGQWQQAPGPLGAPAGYPQGEGFGSPPPSYQGHNAGYGAETTGSYPSSPQGPSSPGEQFGGPQSQQFGGSGQQFGQPQSQPGQSQPGQSQPGQQYGSPGEQFGGTQSQQFGGPGEQFGGPQSPQFGGSDPSSRPEPSGRPEPHGASPFAPPLGSPFGPPAGSPYGPPSGSPVEPGPSYSDPQRSPEQRSPFGAPSDEPGATSESPSDAPGEPPAPPSDESGQTMVLPRYEGPGSSRHRSQDDEDREPGTPPGQ